MKILFSGGGTLGPVTPLLAVADAWRKKDTSVEMVWVGTPKGPEHILIESRGIPFRPLTVARLTRYLSGEWLFFPLALISAFSKAAWILWREKPDIIASAGGYTSVPIVLVGWMMRIPSWVHQSDVEPILTNRLLAPFATWVTTTWQQTHFTFAKRKTACVGNPVRSEMTKGSRAHAEKQFGLQSSKPTVLVIGGGTGSVWLNELADMLKQHLASETQLIHLTGAGKLEGRTSSEGHVVKEMMTSELSDAYAIADVVVSRAGAGAIAELSACKKATVIIPLPKSPQEKNADAIKNASVVCEQSTHSKEEIAQIIQDLLDDPVRRLSLGERLGQALQTDVANKIMEMILKGL